MARPTQVASSQKPSDKADAKQQQATRQTRTSMPDEKKASAWRAKYLTPWNGRKGTSPSAWPMFKGHLPRSDSSFWHDQTCWPKNVVLYAPQIDRVLKRFGNPDDPKRISREMVKTYVRNFDDEGYVVKASLTSNRNWKSLPLRHEDNVQEVIIVGEVGPEKEHERSGGNHGNRFDRAGAANSTGGINTGSDIGETTGQEQTQVIPDTTNPAHESTHAKSTWVDYNIAVQNTTVPTFRPFVSANRFAPNDDSVVIARAKEAFFAARNTSNTASPVREPREASTASGTTDQSNRSTTASTNATAIQGPSRLGKRLAESADLRQEVKRLRAENDQKSATIRTLDEEAGDYKEKLSLIQTERASKGDKSKDLERENDSLQARLKKCEDEKAILRSALGKSLYYWDYLDQKYGRDIKQDDEQEEDDFLEGLKAELGKEEFDRLLELGRSFYQPMKLL
ncbi:hypothetical protein HDK77DRAFT_511042 [Phyllosticta capitalensis]|uniref:Uncharacterized protein n=1 Tax=Phyllosticta capitalensis TaxID=121624 RepID=A0ABR1YK05_9PEZI